MVVPVEQDHYNESPYNPGRIKENNSVWRWLTEVIVGEKKHQLMLDIVGVPEPDATEGIASFVVMEQEQSFLNDMGRVLARAIAEQTIGSNILLMTVESKGSHFLPWVWLNLRELIGERILPRTIVFRKSIKNYMRRKEEPFLTAIIKDQEIDLSKIIVPFFSITSPDEQNLVISPKDIEYLGAAIENGAEPVVADDFIGKGGTISAIGQSFQRLDHQLKELKLGLELKPPRLVAVIGSDGDLYKQTIEPLGTIFLPKPHFPLRLPTFTRQDHLAPWRVNV